MSGLDIRDVIGIGFGPANIALAVLMEERLLLQRALFLERKATSSWHPGQMFEGADIQHNPLRDFVTPRNPCSSLGFLSYLKSVGRLFDFLNLDQPFPPRSEYAAYVQWVADHFEDRVIYGDAVDSLNFVKHDCEQLCQLTTRAGRRLLARSVVLAPGRTPLVPAVFANAIGRGAVHASDYLFELQRRLAAGDRLHRIAVVGASQSAVEIVLDLHARLPEAKIEMVWRGHGIKLKDTSPFTEHIYFPEFVDYYHSSSEADQRRMSDELWRSNYGSADHDVIAALYLKLYEQKVRGDMRLYAHPFSEVTTATSDGKSTKVTLRERNTGSVSTLNCDLVIVACGYRNFGAGPERELFHPLLANIAPHVKRRSDNSLHILRNFQLASADPDVDIPPVVINGLCESTHGFGDAGSFSLLSVRAVAILDGLEASLGARSAKAVKAVEGTI